MAVVVDSMGVNFILFLIIISWLMERMKIHFHPMDNFWDNWYEFHIDLDIGDFQVG